MYSYIYIYICVCVCTYIYLCACVCACVCLCAHACAHVRTVCVRVRLHLFRLMIYYLAPRVRVRYIPPGTGCPRGQRQVWRNAHVGCQRPAGVPRVPTSGFQRRSKLEKGSCATVSTKARPRPTSVYCPGPVALASRRWCATLLPNALQTGPWTR